MPRGGARKNAGRKPKQEEARIKDLCLSAVGKVFGSEDALFEELAKLAKTAKSHRDKISAVTKLLEYAYGRPKESMTLDFPEQLGVKLSKDVRNLTGLTSSKAKGDT